MSKPTTLPAVLALVIALLAAPAARADTRFEFLFNSNHADNDNQFFLNLAVGNSGYPRHVIEPVLPRLHAVETDLPVVLLLARESGRPIEFIVGLRSEGLGWSAIFDRCSCPYEVLFAGVERDPGPPYGKAWGHWRNHPKKVRFTDDEIVSLVHLQTARRVTGLSAYEIARARHEGKPVASIVAERKGGRGHVSAKAARADHSRPAKKVHRSGKADEREGEPHPGKRREGGAAKGEGKRKSK